MKVQQDEYLAKRHCHKGSSLLQVEPSAAVLSVAPAAQQDTLEQSNGPYGSSALPSTGA